MIKIGVVGLGQIAQKAYLPVMAEKQDQAEWVLCTRNKSKGRALQEKYGFKEFVSSLDELIQTGIGGCFVHTPTSTHYSIVKQLLEAGISVMVDKPLSENLDEVQELLTLAKINDLILMVGFNRRYAPLITQVKEVPHKNMLIIQKNRVAVHQETKEAIYDLFIHIADLAVFLLDNKIISVESSMFVDRGILQRALLKLETDQATAVVSMNMFSGANTESVAVMTPGGTFKIENLSYLTQYKENQIIQQGFSDWTPTLEKRGFIQLIDSFISKQAVKPANRKNTQKNILLSHKLCEQMLAKESAK